MKMLTMMQYRWTTYGNGRPPTTVGVEIRQGFDRPDLFAVIISEDKNNTGPSVTNMFEVLATQIYLEHLMEENHRSILWVECYPGDEDYPYGGHGNRFELVEMDWSGQQQKYTEPRWHQIPEDELYKLLDMSPAAKVENV